MNSDSLHAAQKTVKTLAASSRLRSVSPASDCSEVVTLASQLTVLAMKYPSSPDLLPISAQITGASSITCSEEEKRSLTSLEKPFVEALAHIDNALESVQQQLLLAEKECSKHPQLH